MPPLKEYIFECVLDSSMTIVICAYQEITAHWKLERQVKEPKNFILKG